MPFLDMDMNMLKSGLGRGRAGARRLPLLILGLLPVPENVGGGNCIENHVFLKVWAMWLSAECTKLAHFETLSALTATTLYDGRDTRNPYPQY